MKCCYPDFFADDAAILTHIPNIDALETDYKRRKNMLQTDIKEINYYKMRNMILGTQNG